MCTYFKLSLKVRIDNAWTYHYHNIDRALYCHAYKLVLYLSYKVNKEVFFSLYCTDRPPVLFEVSCCNNSVQIGGYPWHYIYTPLHKNHKGTHHICSLKDSTLVGFRNPPNLCYNLLILKNEWGSLLQNVVGAWL